jgi:predicted PurR-regulated permease PerM
VDPLLEPSGEAAAHLPAAEVALVPEAIRDDAGHVRTFAMARGVALQALLALGGLVAFLLLLLEFSAETDPLLIAIAGGVLLWPLRGQPAVRAVLMAGALLLGVWLLRVLGGVLAPFILVYVVAYLLHPLVTLAQRRWRVPRWLPALAVTLLFVGVLAAVVFLLVPALVGQIESLARRVVELATLLPDIIARADFLDSAERAGIIRRQELVAELRQFLPEQVGSLVGRLPAALAGLTRSVGALIGIVTTVVLVPVLLFYMLVDFATIRDALVRLLPRYRGSRAYMARVGDVVGGYLRGQLTISLIAAIVVTIPLMILGVPFALVIGLLTGLLNMIPTIGAILSYVIGGLLMLAFGTWGDVAIVIGVIAGESLLEQSILTPRIMGAQVGMHPVLVMVSLFIFSALMGPIGLFVGVPATALLVGVYRAFQGELTIDLAQEDPGAVRTG